MKGRIAVLIFFMIAGVQFQSVASGNVADQNLSADPMEKGIELFSREDLAGAADAFKQAAAARDTKVSAAGYYNLGTVQAMLAGGKTDTGEKRELLENASESLKRAIEIGALPEEQQTQARRNMEVVRRQLANLPGESGNQKKSGSDKDSNGQQTQQSGGQQSDQSGQQQQAGSDSQNGQSGSGSQSPGDLLEKQKELTERTEGGQGSDSELADSQKQLQQASEAAAEDSSEASSSLQKAAASQAKAAEALTHGDRTSASEYQKEAEKALSEASSAESGDQEVQDILNQESDYEAQKNRLDKTGGVANAEKDW